MHALCHARVKTEQLGGCQNHNVMISTTNSQLCIYVFYTVAPLRPTLQAL